MIRKVNNASKMYGLKISSRKQKSMPSSYYRHEVEFIIDNIKFEQAVSFKYLRSAVTTDDNGKKGMSTHIC